MLNPPLEDHTSSSPLHSTITRTVAIIKNHALQHRFDIERRIQEASFEIVKERQMEFDTETDPDTLYELFGDDATSFAEGPVWVYVLERRRAVEVWNTLMGPRDPDIARQEVPNSLRALYGISAEHNAIMGSPDAELAEIQIASVFVSSPPFPPNELPPDGILFDSLDSEHQPRPSDEGYAESSGTTRSSTAGGRRSTANSARLNANGKPLFRARPIPPTAMNPDIVPRTTRAAALRAGQPIEKKASGPRQTLTKEQMTRTFLNVPGHKRAETIAVASTAAPTIAPRMTKAAALRIGLMPSATPMRRSVTDTEKAKKTFEGVPGHKRRETISVASTKAPLMAPKTNKSAALRAAQKEITPPPSSFHGAAAGTQPPSRPATSLASTRPSISRASSVLGLAPRLSNGVLARSKDDTDTPALGLKKATSGTPGARPRPSSISLPPSIPPRTNRSAALRAAKKEMENAQLAAKAAAARNNNKPGSRSVPGKAPPTSFKAPPPVAS